MDRLVCSWTFCLMCWALHRSLTMIYYDEMLNVINIDARILSSPWHFTKFAYMFSQIKQRHFWKPQICAHINYKTWYLIPTAMRFFFRFVFAFISTCLILNRKFVVTAGESFQWNYVISIRKKKLIWNFKMFACICMYKIPF